VAADITPASQAGDDAAPYILRVPHKSRKPVGLLYPPDVLARLVAGQPADSVPKRIADAVRQQTPIVVMWVLPASLFSNGDPSRPPSYPRPYKIAIVNAGDDPAGGKRVDPIWIQQEASELRQIDSRTPFEEVGAVAAFPRDAFVPGRHLFIYSDYWTEQKQFAGHRIWATIEWNGAAQ
jgi:hypothetical protein